MGKSNSISYLLILVLVALSSCVTNKSTRYLQDIKGLDYPEAQHTDYRLKVRDEISFLVYSVNKEAIQLFGSGGQMSQAYSYIVYDDGTIDIPFVHKIYIEGLSLKEATEVIQNKLREYIPDVHVKIALASKNFYILGEGNGRGVYPVYKERLTILEALALGGDLSVNANRKNVSIIREQGGDKKIMSFDIRSKELIDSDYYYIQPNDIIYIRRSKKGFYKINSFTGFLGMISSSLTFVLLVTNYSSK